MTKASVFYLICLKIDKQSFTDLSWEVSHLSVVVGINLSIVGSACLLRVVIVQCLVWDKVHLSCVCWEVQHSGLTGRIWGVQQRAVHIHCTLQVWKLMVCHKLRASVSYQEKSLCSTFPSTTKNCNKDLFLATENPLALSWKKLI